MNEYNPDRVLAFVDTETTGLDENEHEIFEIALQVRHESVDQVVTCGPWNLWLPVDISRAHPRALEINRYPERLAERRALIAACELNEPLFHDPARVARLVAEQTRGAHLVGMNPSFDARFLAKFLVDHGETPGWHYHLVDCEALVAGRLQLPPPWSSDKISRALGVEPPGAGDRHGASGDMLWTERVYNAVMRSGQE